MKTAPKSSTVYNNDQSIIYTKIPGNETHTNGDKFQLKFFHILPVRNVHNINYWSFFKMFHEISLNSGKFVTHFTLHFYKYYTKFTKNFLGFLLLRL